jgi:putative membrane protein
MYFYIKAIHIIFIVTWFSGMFYIVRLFIYNTEAGDQAEPDKLILRKQFNLMIRRLWLGITWPSAILTFILGFSMAWMYGQMPGWLWVKLILVAGLYAYHFSLHKIYLEQLRGEFHYSSGKLRIWNELATVFLVAIVILVTVKQELSLLWGMMGLGALILLLLVSIRIYKIMRR